ncbi:hypothetical protein ACO1LA_14325, partial [Staphylococcus aureus]
MVPAGVTVLVKGVLREMFLTKLKTAALVAGSLLIVGGVGLGLHQAVGADAPAKAEKAADKPAE